MSLVSVAMETLTIAERGTYQAPSGGTLELKARIDAAVQGTILYRPGDYEKLEPVVSGPVVPQVRPRIEARIEVTGETTAQASRRLLEEGCTHVAALNFASAVSPGGGFLHGARAQEEDLCRCSALYPCLLTQPDYYQVNRAFRSSLYTDHIIYSPDVPFFRDDNLELIEAPFEVSIITAPAPYAGAVRRNEPEAVSRLPGTLERRGRQVLQVAAHQGHRVLVLGAWGCGAFENDPELMADIFAKLLEEPRFQGAFGRVVFGVYDRTPARAIFKAFEARFGG